MNIKVKFRGETYWFLTKADGDFGPLAPLNHCDNEGNVTQFWAESFAHVGEDGKIRRYHSVIGTREDLEIVT